MKKLFLMCAAAVAAFSLASCSDDCKDGKCDKKSDRDAVYTGVMPGADNDGIRYTIIFDYDHDGNKGDYTMVETFLKADSLSAFGYKDLMTYASEGNFVKGEKDGKTYLKLDKDAEDSAVAASTGIYFLVDSDSTLTLVGPDLVAATTPGMNYTLVKGQM